MTTHGLLSEPLAAAQHDYRHRPPRSLFRLVADALLEVAEAMLRPESEASR